MRELTEQEIKEVKEKYLKPYIDEFKNMLVRRQSFELAAELREFLKKNEPEMASFNTGKSTEKPTNLKILAIDVETTGLDPETCQIIEFGCAYYDVKTKEQKSKNWILRHKEYVGSPYALALNVRIFRELADPESAKEEIVDADKFVVWHLVPFLRECGFEEKAGQIKIRAVAGKNYSAFDKNFCERLPDWKDALRINRRAIDPGMLFLDWENDYELPSLEECKKRAGMLNSSISHRAEEDAIDVLDVIKVFYERKTEYVPFTTE